MCVVEVDEAVTAAAKNADGMGADAPTKRRPTDDMGKDTKKISYQSGAAGGGETMDENSGGQRKMESEHPKYYDSESEGTKENQQRRDPEKPNSGKEFSSDIAGDGPTGKHGRGRRGRGRGRTQNGRSSGPPTTQVGTTGSQSEQNQGINGAGIVEAFATIGDTLSVMRHARTGQDMGTKTRGRGRGVDNTPTWMQKTERPEAEEAEEVEA